MGFLSYFTRRRSPKVFGIGTIKTGTTSLGKALEIMGFNHSNSDREYLLRCLGNSNLKPIFKYADRYDSFEDWPWPMLYKEMEQHYPNSRFILTLRSDEQVWLQSVVKHAKWVGPTYGRALFFDYSTPLGHEQAYLDAYRRHVEEVREYFAQRPGKLLEICWEKGHGWHELCAFLEQPVPDTPFPVLNTATTRIWK